MRNHIDTVRKLLEAATPDQGPDHVVMSVPLFLRCLEWARESSPTDVDLHKFVENVVGLDKPLDIEDYMSLLQGIDTPPEPEE